MSLIDTLYEEPQSLSEAVFSKMKRKVGIVSHLWMRDSGDYEVRLYIVDVDEESRVAGRGDKVKEFFRIDPAVRFRFPKRISMFAVCVVNHTVYIFGGHNPRRISPVDTTKESARKFVLSKEVLAQKDYQVKEEQLTEICIMHHIKGFPVAIPAPSSNRYILVFGTYFLSNESSRAFELYDTVLDSWEKLPGLPWSCSSNDEIVEVKCYSFTSERRFFVATNKGPFSLDLIDREWTILDPLYLCMPNAYFVTAKGRYALTTRGETYDFGVSDRLLSEAAADPDGRVVRVGPQFPLSTFAPSDIPAWLQQVAFPSIVPLNPGEGEAEDGEFCNTCVLQLDTALWQARLLIDVCHTELKTLNTTVSKTSFPYLLTNVKLLRQADFMEG